MGFFYELRKREAFCPSAWGMLVNTSYLIRKGLGDAIRRHSDKLGGTLLDFGCGSSPYKGLLKVDQYIGLELAQEGHPAKYSPSNLLYSGQRIPLEDGSVDSILMTEVIEHVFNPTEILAEFQRILRPGGHLLITCPFVWPLHEEPYDYARYTPFALKHLLVSAGLEAVALEQTGSWVPVLAQMMLTYATNSLTPREGRLHFLFQMFWCALFNPLAKLLTILLPKNGSLYFNNVVLARKPA